MAKRRSAAATEVKNRFGDYLAQVVRRREPLLIKKHGKPVAILLPYDDTTEGNEPRPPSPTPVADALRRFAIEFWKKHPDAKPFSAVDLIRQVREEEDGF